MTFGTGLGALATVTVGTDNSKIAMEKNVNEPELLPLVAIVTMSKRNR